MAGFDIPNQKVVAGHICLLRQHAGFTMVELIVVLILVGVLGAIGASRFYDNRGFGISASAEQTRAILRYAQKLAIAQNRDVFVRFDGANIHLCYKADNPCPGAEQVRMPTGGAGMTPSPYTGAPNHFRFNALGRPLEAATPAALPALTLTVAGDVQAPQIRVAPETGYVS